MKFILSILALLAIAFLVGCSAKDTSDNNKLSNSEITKLGKKYGGVYVFNKKFEKEIDDRERERRELKDCYENKLKSECEQVIKKQITTNGYFLNRVWNNNKDKFMKKYNSSDENIALDRYISHIVNKKIYPIQTLSNGKKYYTTYIDYERASKKILPNISSFYEDKIKMITGEEAYKYASVLPLYLYIDGNDEPVYISMSVSYSYKTKKYGFFGDEGRRFSLSRDEIRYTKGGNKFYIEDLEKQ